MWTSINPFRSVEDEGCRVTYQGQTYTLDLEQSHNAAIITAESIRRKLPPHAATVALATAMQESKLRNLDYGDRDSVGLFQQRPSQGWGTQKQIMDPWYSSGKFYEELVKFSNWRSISVNDAAQQVQRSGYPEAYAKHEPAARAWASVLTGQTASTLSCINRSTTTTSASAISAVARKGLGGVATSQVSGSTVTFTAANATTMRAAVALTMASSEIGPVARATVDTTTWVADDDHYAEWTSGAGPSASPAAGSASRHSGSVAVRT